ncbi:helix-turn-helix domain-containing protein [Erythrobacter crassostreae]|uniref:AraC family transcriptional regulator n=1 Tax=Erythrobacter crassostreae TaxID=2828328 RepID=A0A9X1F168_9SPHN|nr:helix-turn-helix domain-containing protein [Erythrobacter crassostrea]MBV7258421.1 AraC family transcriptional regulator [Erythrobacter crassostrea]
MQKGQGKDTGSAPDYKVRSNFHAPPSEFDGCFTTFYHLTLDVKNGGIVHDYLQPEWGNIRFFCGGCPSARIGTSQVTGARFNATGPSSLPAEFELGTSEMWGIGFLPLGWARFVDVDAHTLANTVCDGAKHPDFKKFASLEDVLCDPEATRDEQFDAIVTLMGRLMRHNRDEPKILRVHTALVDGEFLAVSDLAEACGMSIRTLERVCRRYFGFTPKRLMRRQRFTRSLTTFMLHQGSRWTEAMDGEYHDQAQFTREFKEFMSMNPSEYSALDHPILSSFMEARARVWGSAAQALDKPSR